jgi:hypothetical protein
MDQSVESAVDMAFAIRPDLQPDEAQVYAARAEISMLTRPITHR